MMSEFYEFIDSERHVIDLQRVIAFSKGFDELAPQLEVYTSVTDFFTLQYHDVQTRNFDYATLVTHLTGLPSIGGAE